MSTIINHPTLALAPMRPAKPSRRRRLVQRLNDQRLVLRRNGDAARLYRLGYLDGVRAAAPGKAVEGSPAAL